MVRMVSAVRFRRGLHIAADQRKRWSVPFLGPVGRAVYRMESTYRTSPNEVTSRSMADPLRRKDFTYGMVVTPLDEAL
jgi:hypothetical protein